LRRSPAIRQRNLKTIGILGTRTVMEIRLYGGIFPAAIVLPEGEAIEQVPGGLLALLCRTV
jgi:aspartate/glutamate racemase